MKNWSRGVSTVVVVLVILLVAAVAGGTTAVVILLNRDTGEPVSAPQGLAIGYAQGATIMDEADAQQKAINDMLRGGPGISIDYKSDAYSTNGTDFDCYLANSDVNTEDMYIQICADAEMTDTLFLSQLIRPGYAFRTVTLNRSLPEGDNPVYVCFTTVGQDENGEQVITGQTTFELDFHVTLET